MTKVYFKHNYVGTLSSNVIPASVMKDAGLEFSVDGEPIYLIYIGGAWLGSADEVLTILGYNVEVSRYAQNGGYESIYILPHHAKYVDQTYEGSPSAEARYDASAEGLKLLNYDFEKLRRRLRDHINKVDLSHKTWREALVASARNFGVKIF